MRHRELSRQGRAFVKQDWHTGKETLVLPMKAKKSHNYVRTSQSCVSTCTGHGFVDIFPKINPLPSFCHQG